MKYILSVKKMLVNFKNGYVDTKWKRIELFVILVSSFVVWFLQGSAITNVEAKAYVGQIQGFISVYIAFRYGIFGMIFSLVLNIFPIFGCVAGYINTNHYSYLVGLFFTLLTMAWVIVVGILSQRQENQKREMQRLAITDELTGVYNQRYFHVDLNKEINKASKTKDSIGLILIDIDNFRMYNDLYSHDYGDSILKITAAILRSVVNKKDKVFRFGSDEFAVLVKGRNLSLLELEAKRIHEKYEKVKKNYYKDDLANKITISIGLSQYPDISASKEELISHSDMALYQAKNLGEDKVNYYQDIMLQINKTMQSDEQMIGVFRGLLSTITAKDKYTVGHCERVSSYATIIGEAMGFELEEIQTLLYAGLLHDIGKIELPRSVLNKIGRLTDEEFDMIRKHPIHSASILEPLSEMDNLIYYVKHHHERYDGKGYPDGLKGEEISIGARILCIADSFDAMVSERPYRKSMSVEDAFLELKRCSGSQFDPEIAKIFINTMKKRMSIKYNYKIKINNSSFEKVPVL
ncbi:diguanylate cyclase [Herbivorax sp. ANBcel31]|uniref:bifunctional diguanylate cyclase/phosphohydrolase n=1 Tax=Herbivorax sp. ANBcel31 TaxID=3069754 RepID=UPI0027B4A12D|nr:HD domain-containing phosphohydrolase [Herbivorax sp. ANBcel31]MDQ2087784.1 diguanylate cyclase [Herbivorax sp. ANBcel31]